MRRARRQWIFLLALIYTQVACSAAAPDASVARPVTAGDSAGRVATPATQAVSESRPATNSAGVPHGMVESALSVIDPVFGFGTRALALERRVEMLQWQRDAQGAYVEQWSAARIDSSGFDRQHANPSGFPFNGARWWTRDARLDGHPVSPDLLAALGAWRPYAPDLRQLPLNLAANFQPDGDWLSTSQDPRHPAVGDVRLRWRILERAAPPQGVALREGRWELPADIAATATLPQIAPAASTSGGSWMRRTFGAHLALLAIIGVVLAALLLLWRHRR
jgi:hypothetical protein